MSEEGFEEVVEERKRPEFRVVQSDRGPNGEQVYRSIGAMWKNISKNGRTFYTLKIGNLRLLVFPNDQDSNNQEVQEGNSGDALE